MTVDALHKPALFHNRSKWSSQAIEQRWDRLGPQTAIVIGAGIGGLATAARLARAGFHVTVLEKSSAPGGRVYRYEREGYTFDTGATMYLMPQVFEQVYQELGERVEDHLDLIRVDPSCRIHFRDGDRIDLTGDMAGLQNQLEARETGSFGQALRYLGEAADAMRVGLERFVGRDFRNPLEYFTPANIPLFFQMKAHIKHYRNVSSYFQHPHLRQAFSFQNMYLGLSPFDAPATYSVLQFTEMADGVQFPRGGMYAVIESMMEICRRNGVQFRFHAPVVSIDVQANKATGVTLEGGTRVKADIVIANADLPYVYDQLLPDRREAARLKKMEYTCSELVFLWGLKKTYPQLLQHNIFLSGDYQRSFEKVFKDRSLPDEPSFYVNIPARGDSRLAPDGKDGMMVMVPVGHLDPSKSQDWEAITCRARQSVIDRLRSVGIDDIEQNLAFEAKFGPQEYQSQLNLMKGAAFGLGYQITQIGYLRPHNKHRRYSNLYFVGASTHPGGGVPMVLISSRLVAERVIDDWRPALAHRPVPAYAV
jgi:phytoene desaturase